jgi:hypothetical protein
MKKMISKALLALMLSGVLFASTGITAEASCSGWTVASRGSWQCRRNRCGFLWLNSGTNTRTNTEERWCSGTGTQVRSTRLRDETGGCCNA